MDFKGMGAVLLVLMLAVVCGAALMICAVVMITASLFQSGEVAGSTLAMFVIGLIVTFPAYKYLASYKVYR